VGVKNESKKNPQLGLCREVQLRQSRMQQSFATKLFFSAPARELRWLHLQIRKILGSQGLSDPKSSLNVDTSSRQPTILHEGTSCHCASDTAKGFKEID
jgi:hypothetical protein